MSVVTLALAKSALMVSHTAQDAYIQAMLNGVEDWVAKHLGVSLTSGTCQDDLDGGDIYLFPKTRPITAVASVTDLWGNETYPFTVESQTRIRWNLLPVYGVRETPWPHGVARFRVAYTAGYTAMPAGVQLAILQLCARAYEARAGQSGNGAAGASISFARLLDSDIAALLKPYRRAPQVMVG